MNKNNLYGLRDDESTELAKPQISIEQKDNNKEEKEILNEFKSLINIIMLPNMENINLKRDKYLYITLIMYFLISIICIFTSFKLANFFMILILMYITLVTTTKITELPNSRYMKIATWNLYNSLSLTIKGINANIIKYSIYHRFLTFTNIAFFISLGIGIIPSFSHISIIALFLLLISYISSFCNQDLESIQESLKHINLISPIIINICSIIGSFIYGSNALNITGYLIWLFLHSSYHSLKNYKFENIEKEVL